jgi:hypothetical protein
MCRKEKSGREKIKVWTAGGSPGSTEYLYKGYALPRLYVDVFFLKKSRPIYSPDVRMFGTHPITSFIGSPGNGGV